MIATELKILPIADGTVQVSITLPDRSNAEHLTLLSLNCDKFDVEIKKHRKKRSLTANSYMWQLLNKLAVVLNTTKEELYQESIRRVGVFTHVAVPNEAVESFIKRFNAEGIGNFAEATEKAKSDEYTVICTYFGSSTYDSAEMARLIDYIVQECKDQGVETLPDNEVRRLIEMVGD